jgi:flagellin-like hook-associated protein FlgL
MNKQYTLPPTQTCGPQPALAAGYRSVVEESPPVFQTISPVSTTSACHESTLFTSSRARAPAIEIEAQLERLIALETMMQWIYRNQLKVLEKMDEVMSDIGNVQEGLESVKAAINKLSDGFNRWLSDVGCGITDRLTNSVVNGNFLAH